MKNHASKKVNVPLVVLFSVLCLGGIATSITGAVLSSNSMNDPNSFPMMTVLFAVGMAVFIFSFFFLMIVLSPLITRKIMRMNAPLTKEYMREVGVPTIDTLNAPTQECPECHTENPSNANYCSKCGKELTKICPQCNSKNSANSEYCNHCGTKL